MLATLNVPGSSVICQESRVFAVGVLVSLIVRVPLELPDPKVITGEVALRASGEVPDKVTIPDAPIVVTSANEPVLVMPLLLLLMPPFTVNSAGRNCGCAGDCLSDTKVIILIFVGNIS